MANAEQHYQAFVEPDGWIARKNTEDYVEYFVYVVDETLAESGNQALLKKIQSASRELQQKLLQDYIWHCEGFSLELRHRNR